jgi:hypothetical protein
MNTLALSALALASATNSAHNPSDDHDWLTLDRDIASLSSALVEDKAGAAVTGYIKTSYDYSSDFQTNGNDTSGFNFQNIRLVFKGKVGPFDLKLSIEGAQTVAGTTGGGNEVVKDAYARFAINDQIHAQMGNFKSPFLSSSVESDDKLIFYDRTTQGSIWGGRELGIQADGQHGPVGWYAAAQNGGDAAGNDMLLFGKVAYAITGDPIPMVQSGGFGIEAPTRVQVAGMVADEGTLSDGTVWAGEAVAISGRIFAEAEVLDYGKDFTAGSVPVGNASKASGSADTTPWDVTAGYMFTEHDEAALRYEDLDDTDNSTRISVGYTRYIEGHAAKVQVNWITTDSDDTTLDGDRLKVGLTVGI